MNKEPVNKQSHKKLKSQLKPVYAAILLAFTAPSAIANPVNPTVVSGSASFAASGNTLTVTNTPGTIINWQGFSIGATEITRFAQQSASSAVLNRVVSNNPSSILGTLQSNGRVFLINPNGIVFGAGATVDVAGLVASSLNLSNEDFLAGRYHFTAVPGAQKVSNAGNVTAQDGGQIYLIAPDVENTGVITAPNGEILLAAGHSVDLVSTSSPNLIVNITAPAGDATNVGQLIAESGSLGLFGTVVRNSGAVSADSATMEGGKIVFRASQRVEAGGTISASGAGGGTIEVLADMQSGTVNVTGNINASAPVSGNGGFIDTSAAHVQVADSARVTTLAANGANGTWLIDPFDFNIAATGGNMTGAALSTSLAAGNVVIASTSGTTGVNGDVNVNDVVSWSVNKLTLNALNNINISANLNGSGTASLALEYGQLTSTGIGAGYFLKNGVQINLPAGNNFSIKVGSLGAATNYYVITSLGNSGSVTGIDLQGINGNLAGNYVLGGDIDATATFGWNAGQGFSPLGNGATMFSGNFNGLGHSISNLTINGPSYAGLFGRIGAAGKVADVGLLGGAVSGNLSAGGLACWNEGVINNSSASGVVVNGFYTVGGLVGLNSGTISNSYVSGGTLSGGVALDLGGLVGLNKGSISTSHVSGTTVSGLANVGGLVGRNEGGVGGAGIVGSTSVTGAAGTDATISNSYVNGGSVTGTTNVGGLVGLNQGGAGGAGATATTTAFPIGSGGAGGKATISNSYASGGLVSGTTSVGGLIGSNLSGSAGAPGSFGAQGGVGGVASTVSSLWDFDTTGRATAIGTGNQDAVTQLNSSTATINAFNQTTYAGWDFTGTWWMSNLNTRPFLRSEWSADITNAHQLQLMSMNLGATYKLGGNIDMAETATGTGMWGASGFVPVGTNVVTNFTGKLDGAGHTINNLFINRPAVASVGLFGWLGTGSAVSNLGLVGGSVTGWYRVGGLAGYSAATLNTVYVSGMSVAGAGLSTIGGLVGQNGFGGSITNSYVDSGTVTGNGRWIGGMVGFNETNITNSHVNNTPVTGINANSVGGLAGYNTSGVITNCYVSNGSVSGRSNVGGMLGINYGFITGGSYVSNGSVAGTFSYTGGLVGYNANTILSSHVQGGTVTGNFYAGGLTGWNSGPITSSYVSSVTVAGASFVGGLAGYSSGSVSNSYVNSGAVTATWHYGGLVGLSPVTSPINNSHYNINGVTINGSNQVTRFGLYNDVLNNISVGQFDDWLNGGNPTPLNIANYAMLPGSGGNYTVGGWLGMQALLGFADNPAYTFTLTANIDLTTHPGYYIPLLAANFNGGNFTISNLSLNQQNDYLGMFGMIGKDGSVSNLKLLNASVTGINNVGGLAGWNEGSIVNSSSTNGIVSGSWDIGGLVGHNEGLSMFNSSTSGYITSGSISGSFVSGGSVNGTVHVGGLVGSNLGGATTTWNPTPGSYFGTISNSYVTGGTVSGSSDVGGLVGYARGGGIFSSYVDSGNVSGGWSVGGLVGFDSGEGGPSLIDNSYANLTSVNGWSNVGGLVGNHGGSWLVTNVSINNSYVSNGSVSGGWNVGGLVGYNGTGTRSVSGPSSFFFGASISNSYVTGGTVTGSSSNVGGLAGFNKGAITNSYVSGGSVNGMWNVGGLVGNNAFASVSSGSTWGWWSGGSIASSFVDTGTVVSGLSNVGGLVGNNFGDISSSHVSNGVVSATGAGFVSLGGLVGINQGSISNSYVDGGSVTAASGSTIGGLVGYNSYGSIKNSYVNGGTVSGRNTVGGLVGSNFYGNVIDTYVIGSSVIATSTISGVVGGLVGYNVGSISNSYASSGSLSGTYAGGVVGWNALAGTIAGTFWDTAVGVSSGIGWDETAVPVGPSNNGATGLATADTMNSATLASAGFSMTNWWMSDGNTRPFLQMEWSANITNAHQLQLMSMNLGAAYTLGANLDMSETATGTGMWSSAGFVPVGDSITSFTGTFDGLNNTISNLTINRAANFQGLFGYASGSVISNVGLINANVAGSNSVGGLLGYNGVGSLVVSSYASGGTISGSGGSVGGLVGGNDGSIGNSFADSVTVSGGIWSAGGLVGRNQGSVTGSHVSNSLVSATGQEVGGLVGRNDTAGNIADSYVIGSAINGTFGVGGLVGIDDGVVSNSHYNINSVLINGGNAVTVGGLFNDVPNLNAVGQFDDWFADYLLNPADYATLTAVGVDSYSINSTQGMKDLLGFADNSRYSFSLAGNIDLAAAPGLYVPVLAGNFDGANFTVSNLSVSGNDFKVALFGELKSTGTVSNLGVLNASVTSTAYGVAALVGLNSGGTITNCFVDGASITASGYVGGLVGWNDGVISNAYVSNSGVTATQTNGTSANVGGLVGINTGTISNSYVSGGSVTGVMYVGGLVGLNTSGAIDTSYASGTTVLGVTYVGGLVGSNEGGVGGAGGAAITTNGLPGAAGADATINNSYVNGGSVTGTTNVGGLVGLNQGGAGGAGGAGHPTFSTIAGGTGGAGGKATISNSYASGGLVSGTTSVGGLIGSNLSGTAGAPGTGGLNNGAGGAGGVASTVSSLWDFDTTGQAVAIGTGNQDTVTQLTTINAFTQATYAGWDFTNTWWMSAGNTRPFLRSEWSTNITNTRQLQLMSMNLGAAYTLGANIDMSETATGTGMWSSAGFVPVGDSVTPFTGTFDGLNNTISNLTINRAATIPQGLFGYTLGGVISNVGLTNVSVAGSNSVGALLGYNGVGSQVINSYVSAGTVSSSWGVGGLVGANEGSIGTSYVDGVTVNGGNGSVGGLAGRNLGSITASHVTNSAVSGTMQEVGGLVGVNSITGSIADSYVDNSSVDGAFGVGGLVGMNDGQMLNSHYNINSVLINGGTVVTVGGLFNDVPNLNAVGQFTDWFIDGVLNPADYATLTAVGASSYSINSVQGMKDLLGFAEDPVYSFSLAGNIDLAAAPGLYVPVLAGNFDGANFTVSNLNVSGVDFKVGLFGELKSTGTVSNVGVLNASVTAAYGAAGLVGYNNGGTITNCFVDGATLNAFGYVGGLVGWNDGVISNAYVSNSSMTATQTTGISASVGGLAGANTGTITNSYVSGGSVTGFVYVGGVVGYNDSTLGASVATSFWDTALTGGVLTNGVGFDTILVGGTDAGATGLSAAGMMTMTNFSGAGWNVANTGGAGATWRIYEGYTAPLLTSFMTPLTITANSATKTYDSIAYSGGNGTTLSIPAAIVSGTPVYGGTSQGAVNAGIYTLSVSGYFSGQTGYDISYVDGALTINAATVALSIAANNATKTYGTALTFAGTEFTPTGLIGGDTISGVTLTSAGAVNLAAVGNYTIVPSSAVFSSGSASNYIITYVYGQLTVTAAPLTITADALSKVYGDADPALTYVATGLLFTDTLTGGLSRAAGENVGSYSIGSTLANPNYAITYVGNNLSITARPISIAADAVTKVYGDADNLTFTVGGSGLASWDMNTTAFTGALSRTAGENVATSPYAINQGTLAANTNYTITGFTGNNLTITPAPLMVYAYPTSKVLNTADPLLTYLVSGLKLNDTAATVMNGGSLVRDPGEAAGNYLINQGSLALASTNYTMTYVPAYFTILVPTVIDEITNMILLLGVPDSGSAQSTSSSEDEENPVGVIVTADASAEAGAPAQALPVCQ